MFDHKLGYLIDTVIHRIQCFHTLFARFVGLVAFSQTSSIDVDQGLEF